MRPIDHTVYPDLDSPPTELSDPGAKADYVHRICSAWDFGVVPERSTFELLSGWRQTFDRYPLTSSPAYHTFRSWFGWPPVESAGPVPSQAEAMDRREGRGADPCERMI